jgi:hypothetical protein
MAYRMLKYLHNCYCHMCGLGVDPHLMEGPSAFRVSVGVTPMTEGE